MVIKLKIRQKIQLFILSTSIVIFVATIGYISISARNMAVSSARDLADARIQESALNIQDKLNADFSVVRTFSQSFLEYRNLPREEWKKLFSGMYLNVLQRNPQMEAI